VEVHVRPALMIVCNFDFQLSSRAVWDIIDFAASGFARM